MRRFSLYRRGKIWYCRFRNEKTGGWTSGKSTGETEKDEATAWAYHCLKYGIPDTDNKTAADIINVDTILSDIRNADRLDTRDVERIVHALSDRGFIVSGAASGSPGTEDTADFLTRFWSWDDSPYVAEKRSRGHAISETHAKNRLLWVNKYWVPVFRGVPLVHLSRQSLRDFANSLAATDLTAGTKNHVLLSGTVALRWAYQNEIIPADVTAGLKTFSGAPKKRGTLSLVEAETLFSLSWPDSRARLANMTAALTGLRQGEIAALRLQDIGDDRLYVRHSRSRSGALKSTKTNESREVPVLPALRDALRQHAQESPYPIGPGSFIFWSILDPSRPMDPRPFTTGLHDALLRLNCTEDEITGALRAEKVRDAGKDPAPEDLKAERKVIASRELWMSRNVDFHGWRHFYTSTLAGKLDPRSVMHVTGHKSESVFSQYADHVNAGRFERVAAAGAETFGRIVEFPKKEG